MENHQLVLVLDFGGQYNQLIARRVREHNVYCEVKPYKTSIEEIKALNPIGIIFTGGPNSVYEEKSPKCDPALFELGVPVLDICYGCQLMAHTLGGEVTAAQEDTAREYGKTETFYNTDCKLFKGLPDFVDFKEIIEPLRMLFKDEVRQLGFELGLSEQLVMRQPFPGPGLGIRITGEITKEKCDILREADAIFREEIANAGLDKEINQYFAVLTNTRTVGVMGDSRTYDYALALRGVTTSDFMTADWARIPYEVLDKASSRIVNEVVGVNRIVYDITSKPPATIEWE